MSSETNTLCFSNLSALDDKTIGITSGQSDSCFENVLLIKTEVNEAKLGTVEQMKNEDVLSNMPMEEVSIKQEYKDTEEHRLENVFADEIKIEEHELREIISEKPKENFQSYECSAQSEEMTIKEELNPNSLGRAMMTSPKHRKCFSIEEKGAIIRRLEAGESNSAIAKEFGISHSTISTIKKNKYKIKDLVNSNVLKPKRLRKSSQEDVERALLEWFKVQRNRAISVSGSMLQEKANFFASQLEIPNFTCKSSWIGRFKVRHNITTGKTSGQSTINQSDVTDWSGTVWPSLRAQFTDDQIFIADETGFYYKLMPNEASKFKDETCAGGTFSDKRITVLLSANMSGTIKKKLLVIAKSERPRCFEGVRCLPVDYESNQRAWMISEIFVKWVRSWDRQLVKEKKKILLLVDNCPAHVAIPDLRNITLVLLSPDTDSILQPMTQGIIRTLKTDFRKSFLLKIFENSDADLDVMTSSIKITLLDAIIMIYDAWNRLTRRTISGHYQDAGFVKTADGDDQDHWSTDFYEEDDIPLSIWARSINNLPIADEELDQYVHVDNNVITCEDPCNRLTQNISTRGCNSDDNNELEERCSTPNVTDALKAACVLSQFVHSSYEDENIKSAMAQLHNAIRSSYYNTKLNSRLSHSL